MELKAGKVYLVTCRRKGTFMMRVTEQRNGWTYGVVAAGRTTAMLDENVCLEGEDVCSRTEFILSAIEQKKVAV